MNESAHPSPELLASFVDGRLAGEERRAMVAHLDACPDCYEVFAETVRFLGEEEPRGHVLRPPRLAAKRWPRWAAAAAAVVAVAIAVAILRMEPERELLLASGTLVAAIEVPEGVAVAGALWGGWPRGGKPFAGGGLGPEAASFRAGVLLVDLRASGRARDGSSAEAVAEALAGTLEEAGVAAELEDGLEDARRAAARGRFGSLENAAAEIEAGAEELLEPFHLAFGKWAEAGRLAAAVGDRGFFRSPEYVEFRAELEARELPEPVADALLEIDALTREEPGPPEETEALEGAFHRLIGSSG